MANRYLRSTDGNDGDNGSTWPLAKATILGIDALPDVAGDIIYVSQVHAETTNSTITLSLAGTIAAPTRVICANDSATPPTAVATTATFTTTTNAGINLAGGGSWSWYGCNFFAGTGLVNQQILLGSGGSSGVKQVLEDCTFTLVGTGPTGLISVSGAIITNSGFKFADAGQKINVGNGGANIKGGGVLSGGISPTTLFDFTGSVSLIESFDMSQCSSSFNICNVSASNGHTRAVFRNCKLPASWSGLLVAVPSSMYVEAKVEMINSWHDGKNYKYWSETKMGSVRDETTIVRSGGASDGTTSLAWKMVSNSPVFPNSSLVSPDISKWNTTVGTPVTAKIEIVNDGVTLKDDEIWIELEYLGSSAAPLGTHTSDRKATWLTTAANQTSSSTTWTTTGLSSPIKQKLEVTFTPQMVGFVIARVVLARASTTVYADPKIVLT